LVPAFELPNSPPIAPPTDGATFGATYPTAAVTAGTRKFRKRDSIWVESGADSVGGAADD
jgi:hypothetical protein